MVTATDGFLTPNGAAMFWQGSQHKVEPRRKQYGCRIPYCLSTLWPENYKVFLHVLYVVRNCRDWGDR